MLGIKREEAAQRRRGGRNSPSSYQIKVGRELDENASRTNYLFAFFDKIFGPRFYVDLYIYL